MFLLGLLSFWGGSTKETINIIRNLTGEDGFFKEKEIEALEKKADELTKWQDDKVSWYTGNYAISGSGFYPGKDIILIRIFE